MTGAVACGAFWINVSVARNVEKPLVVVKVVSSMVRDPIDPLVGTEDMASGPPWTKVCVTTTVDEPLVVVKVVKPVLRA